MSTRKLNEMLFKWKDKETFHRLLAAGANINCTNSAGEGILQFAVSNWNEDLLKVALEHNVDMNAMHKLQFSPLHLAIKGNNVHFVKILLECGAKPNNEDATCIKTPSLCHAVIEGHLECMVILLKHLAKLNPPPYDLGALLHTAARFGRCNCVEYLLKSGANVQIRHPLDMSSPLHAAVFGKNIDCVNALLTRGADVNAKSITGNGVLHYTPVFNKNIAILTLLLGVKGVDVNIANDAGMTPLMLLAEQGNLDCVRILIKNGANPYLINHEFDTALTMAVVKGLSKVVGYLATISRDLNLGNIAGYTPHYQATSTFYFKISKLIVKEGDGIRISSHRQSLICKAITEFKSECKETVSRKVSSKENCTTNLTPLHHAAHLGLTHTVKTLIEENKVDINNTNLDEETALMVAVKMGNFKTVKYLVECHADVLKRNREGDTALLLASVADHLELVKYLVKFYSDLDIKNNCGETALFQAARKGLLQIVVVLISHGADINSQDNTGMTILFTAAQNARFSCVRFLMENDALLWLEQESCGQKVHLAKSTVNLAK